MSDYKNNPIFNSEIRKIQGHEPNVSFQYTWDDQLSKWVPGETPEINVENLDLTIDLDSTNLILSGISGILGEQGETNDTETHRILSGISDNSEQGNGILVSISDILKEREQNNDQETHRVLSGISGVLEEQGQTNDEETHRLLIGISGILEEQGQTNDTETHRILSGISGDNLTHSYTNSSSLESVRTAIEELDFGEINIENADLSDEETHRILSGISGQDESFHESNIEMLSEISGQDKTHYIENERLLKHIKNSTETLTHAVEELKRDFKDLTFHKKTFGEDGNIFTENSDPGEMQRKSFKKILYNCLDLDEKINRENKIPDDSVVVINESTPESQNIERIGAYDESSPFSIKFERYKGDYDGWYKFAPLAKPIGNGDRVTLFNDTKVPLDIKFRGGDEMRLYGGYQIELTKSESYKMFLRKKYALNGFEIRYGLERMYTPEESIFNDTKEHPDTDQKNTHSLITLGSFFSDDTHLYVSYGSKIKRTALASWQVISFPHNKIYPIDYFDAHTDESFLYLDFLNSRRRVAITEWHDSSKIPIESHDKVWADESFMYVKTHGASYEVGGTGGNDEWRRLAIGEY